MDETNDLEIRGMYCAACSARIEKAVSKIEGVSDVNVNLTTEKGRVTYNKRRTSISEIIQQINRIGYEAKLDRKDFAASEKDKRREISALHRNFIVSALLTLPLAWAMFAHFKWTSFIWVPELFTHPLFQFAVTLPIQIIIGFQFYERAWKALKNRSANMDVLVVLSTSAAFFYSHFLTFTSINDPDRFYTIPLFYETSAFIITFILLGKLLEAKTKLKTKEAIQKLYRLQARTATIYRNGLESTANVEQISPGDVILVKPGERVQIDGQVIEGKSLIDESLLTGESIPVDKARGDLVYAGTINQNGTLKIRVTKEDSKTTLAKIIRIVEEAQASKAPIQHIADNIIGVFVPIVIAIAIGTFAIWYIAFQPGDFYNALEKVIAVLIIACPCALGLATPTSIMVGSGRAAQLGILFKEGKFLEMLGKIGTIVFDKTGTVTKGEPEVTDVHVHRFDKNSFLEIIGGVENHLDHPVAKTIVKKAKSHIRHLRVPTNVVLIPGYGVEATVDGKKVMIANLSFFKKKRISIHAKEAHRVMKLEQEGKTVMMVSIDSRFIGAIAVADAIKPSSQKSMTRLKEMGINIFMLTGDNWNSAQNAAKKLGITSYRAEVAPQDKAKLIQTYQQEGHPVVMVGDGINDAPALKVADVGIALGSGSDVAVESGDVTIMKDDLTLVVNAIKISRKTMTNIKQNLAWAFVYNIVMIPVAMLGYLAPWLAGAAMAFSSVSVVLNSLRLKKVALK